MVFITGATGSINVGNKKFINAKRKDQEYNADKIQINSTDDADQKLAVIRLLPTGGNDVGDGVPDLVTAGQEQGG